MRLGSPLFGVVAIHELPLQVSRSEKRRASSATIQEWSRFGNRSYKRANAVRPYYLTIFLFNHLTISQLERSDLTSVVKRGGGVEELKG